MADVLYLAHADDPTTILWDFVDPNGDTNPSGLGTGLRALDEGGAGEPELILFGKEVDHGDELVRYRLAPRDLTIVQRIYPAASLDALTAGVGQLVSYLVRLRNLVIIRQLNGETEQTAYDVVGAPALASLLREDVAQLDLVLARFQDPRGFPIVIKVQPWRRAAERDSDVNLLRGDAWVADFDGNGVPTGWTWDGAGISAESIDAARSGYRFTLGTVTARRFAFTTPAASYASGDKAAFSFEIEQISGPLDPVSVQAAVQFLTSGGANVGSEHLGTAVNVTQLGRRYRITVVTTAAGATTDKARITVIVDASSTGPQVFALTKPQAEKTTASSAAAYRAGPSVVTNDPFVEGGQRMMLYVDTDLPTPVDLLVNAESGAKLVEVRVAAAGDEDRGARALADHLNATGGIPQDASARGWTVSLENSTAASAPNAVVTVNENRIGVELRRIVATRTTKLDSLRGTWLVLARVRTASDSDWRIRLRYGLGTGDPAPESKDQAEYVHPGVETGSSPSAYSYVPLGHVFVPDDVTLTGVRFETWVERVNGAGSATLEVHDLLLVPADDSAILRVTGQADEILPGNAMIVNTLSLGGETLLPGKIDGGVVKLDDEDEAAGTPPRDNTGVVLPAGAHEYTFYGSGGASWDGAARHRIVDVTTNAVVVGRKVSKRPSKPLELTLAFESVAGHAYMAQVIAKDHTDGTWRWTRLRRRSIPYVTTGQAIRTSPESGFVHKVDSSEGVLAHLDVEGPVPITLGRGWHVLTFVFGDLIKIGHELPEASLTRAPTVHARYSPRRV